MGREGRGARRREAKLDAMEREHLAELAAEAGVDLDAQPGEEGEGLFEHIEWDEHDQPVPRTAPKGRDPWRAMRLGTVQDVARMFAVHFKTVERWRLRDGLPCIRVGGVIRYPLGDILRWASARRVGV